MGDSAYFHSVGPILSGVTPMSGMQVYHYATGGTTAKTAWSDSAKSATVSQPFGADAYGIANFYGDGVYRLVVVDPNSTTLYDIDPIQIGPVQPVEISVHKNGTDQSALSAATWTKLSYSTEEYDAAGTFASDKWTPARTGRALVNAQCLFNSVLSGTSFAIGVYKNGSLVKKSGGRAHTNVSGQYTAGILAQVDVTSVTDYIEVFADPGGQVSDVEGDSDTTWFQGFMLT